MNLATESAEDTREMAGRLATVVRPGDVILLTGELGAGKTTFAQGFGRSLGVVEPITSPTFTLVRQYDEGTRVPFLHADVYRLDQVQEVIDLGLAELIDEGRAALVEWGEVAAPALPADHLTVKIDFGPTDDERAITLEAAGASWAARTGVLGNLLERWQYPAAGPRS